ncbi:glycosyl hydrolase family 28-related protein [Hyalangium versicolor]|uniref:glycosyl hydrolase family 28-related protein n=1 Tax=Hyalangium versicolor TaxID=2861190 RepID=UPI001CC96A47|nr:right-handed parallel beta-helix repeat-containing protein [Hyalangium versicolor]
MSIHSVGNHHSAFSAQTISKGTQAPVSSNPSAATERGGCGGAHKHQRMFARDAFEAAGASGQGGVGGTSELQAQLTQLLDVIKQLTDLLSSGKLAEGGVPELGGASGGASQQGAPEAAAGGVGSPGEAAPPVQPQGSDKPVDSVGSSSASSSNSSSASSSGSSSEAGVVSNRGEAGPPPDAINAKDFGVVGDGKTDDQAALQKALDAAKASGKPLYLGPGNYNHSGVLTLDGVSMVGSGDKTVLTATNPDQGAVKLTGNGAALSNIKTTFASAPSRSSMPDAAAVLIQGATNASVTNMNIQGAASNGVRIDNSSGSKVTNNLVVGTNADGIALMNGASDNLVKNNVVSQAGDDSFSDDSYSSDAKQDSGNTFESNVSLDNAYGRGIVLAGSKDAKVLNNIVSGSKWVGIWGDSDPNSGTMTSSGHNISGNTVINSPNGPAVQYNMAGGGVSGTKTSGGLPDLASILGWDPGAIPNRTSINSVYQPGTGSGANNSGGVRS